MKIQVIEKINVRINRVTGTTIKERLRVCAYARVSTDNEEFIIEHKCAFINEIKTRIIPIQENSLLTK